MQARGAGASACPAALLLQPLGVACRRGASARRGRAAARASADYAPFAYRRLAVAPTRAAADRAAEALREAARRGAGGEYDARAHAADRTGTGGGDGEYESISGVVVAEGDAWGTSEHPTTRLCLRYLVDSLQGGERVLDFGCGTGVLAVAAAALGAECCTGVDIDAGAVATANQNAEDNGLPAERMVACSNSDLPYLAVVRPDKYDVTMSNMLFNEQRGLLPELAALTRPGGRLCVSGLIEEDLRTCADEYGAFFDFEHDGASGEVAHTREEGAPWCCVVGVRNEREVDECVEDLSELAVS